MNDRARRIAFMASRAALAVIVLVSAWLAVQLHRSGHTQGDDFALYLRQARSLFDGDPAAVIADNRFAVVNSDSGFSPFGYPWGWPILLSPFVRLWGFDYDKLKLVEVLMFAVFLVFLHGIVRRRIGRVPALAAVAVIGTAPLYLAHTEQLLTEIPHLATIGLFVWFVDRVRQRSDLLLAPTRDLVIIGLLATVAFNVRREGMALIAAVGVMQLFDLLRGERDGSPAWLRPRETVELVRTRWPALVTPHAAFVGSVALFQFVLPTALFPDNGNGSEFIDERWGEYPRLLTDQLGLGEHPAVGVVILLVAAIGAVVGVRVRPRLDGTILLIALFSAVLIGTHFRQVERYWFQITPWVVYFALVALVAGATSVIGLLMKSREADDGPGRRHLVAAIAVVPLVVIVIAHGVALPGKIDKVSEFDKSGNVLSGPTNPNVAPIYEAVNEFTPPDAVVAYFRARTMTLLTDRRSFQTKNLERILTSADYFAQKRESTYWQPDFSVGGEPGFEEVWSNSRWVLWRIVPNPADVSPTEDAP